MNHLQLTIIGLDPDRLHAGGDAAQSPWRWAESASGPLAERLRQGRVQQRPVPGLTPIEVHCADDPDRLALLATALPAAERERLLSDGWAFWRWQGDCRLMAQAGREAQALADAATAVAALSQLEPVHLKAETDHAVVFGQRFLDLAEAELQQLFADFDRWLREDGYRLVHGHHGRAYLLHPGAEQPGGDRLGERDLPPLACALNRNAEPLISGDDALRPLRRWLTEVQMWLHAHPVNEARARRGQPEINSFWLHGRADNEDDTTVPVAPDCPLWTDSPLLLGAVPASQIWTAEEKLDQPADNVQVVLTEPGWCWLEGDLQGWQVALDDIDRWLAARLAERPDLDWQLSDGRGNVWLPAGRLRRLGRWLGQRLPGSKRA